MDILRPLYDFCHTFSFPFEPSTRATPFKHAQVCTLQDMPGCSTTCHTCIYNWAELVTVQRVN